MKALRGVNLGDWLVVERWMTPSLFSDTTAVDAKAGFEIFQQIDKNQKDKTTIIISHREGFCGAKAYRCFTS